MTTDLLINALSWFFIATGCFFIVVGAIGLIRMPSFYTRLHAASLIDSLGAALLIIGLLLQAGPTLVGLKLVLIYALIFFTGPVASHAVAQAALVAGVKPVLVDDRRPSETKITSSEALKTD